MITTIPPHKMPRHIAIIMDGNRRWAKKRRLPSNAGHKQGAHAVKETLKSCRELNIPYLTLYAFSSENWQRKPEEINDLMSLLTFYLDKELKNLHAHNICLKVIGNKDKLHHSVKKKITHAEETTKNNSAFFLTIAISYGSREEITLATKKILSALEEKTLTKNDITETILAQYLDTAQLPDPDLLIRTGGEKRLSNFLLWQAAYTELCFLDTLWPDFSEKHLTEAIIDFSHRERRYGTE